MDVVSLACNECGAPLPVTGEMRFVTCTHCGARLSIQRRESAVWTEVEELARTQEDLRQRVEWLEQRPIRRRRILRRTSRTDPDREQLDPLQLMAVGGIAAIALPFATDLGLGLRITLAVLGAALVFGAGYLAMRDSKLAQKREERRRQRRAEKAVRRHREARGEGGS